MFRMEHGNHIIYCILDFPYLQELSFLPFKKSGVPREELFLITKIISSYYKNADEQIDATLKRLDVSYFDLLLFHQPYGKVKSIGVCNFIEKDMEKLLSYAKIKPVLIQNECHPYYAQTEMRKKYEKDHIRMEAWFP